MGTAADPRRCRPADLPRQSWPRTTGAGSAHPRRMARRRELDTSHGSRLREMGRTTTADATAERSATTSDHRGASAPFGMLRCSCSRTSPPSTSCVGPEPMTTTPSRGCRLLLRAVRPLLPKLLLGPDERVGGLVSAAAHHAQHDERPVSWPALSTPPGRSASARSRHTCSAARRGRCG